MTSFVKVPTVDGDEVEMLFLSEEVLSKLCYQIVSGSIEVERSRTALRLTATVEAFVPVPTIEEVGVDR